MNTELLHEANIAMDRTKIQLINSPNCSFMNTILFSLKLRWDSTVSTLAVNGTEMFINPQFFMDFDEPLRVFGLLHEVWHVALDHITRIEDRHPVIWNQAGDYVINLLLKKAGITIWEHCLCDDRFDNMTTEEVYAVLFKEHEENKKNGGGEPDPNAGGFGSDIQQPPPPEEGGKTPQETREAIDRIIMKAVTQAKMDGDPTVGNLPGDLARRINSLFKPRIPWERELQNYFSSYNRNNYSYKRPNKRFMPDFYLPSLYDNCIGNIANICDASGSVGQKQFKQFFSEGAYIKNTMKPLKFTIASFDTKIRSEYVYTQDQPLDFPVLEGGGGTAIDPVIDYLNKLKPEIAIIFTDGQFRAPSKKYKGNLIWLIYDMPNFKCDFGKVIHFSK